jgi:hypothetical protein
VIALIVFPVVGAAAALLLRIPLPPSIAGRVAFVFLLGAGAHGALLFAGVPWFVPPLLALVFWGVWGRGLRFSILPREFESGGGASALQAFVFAIPLVVLVLAAAVMPIRDYDGRVTWLPKARAIALESSTTGPFFHGERGLNLHNRYPLLLPLDAATVMRLSNDTRNEAARWLYVLIAVALFVVLWAMLPSRWVAAALPWLGIVTSIEGGALAAYSDFAVAAFFGMAVLYLLEDEPLAAGLFAAFAVMTKNEGLALAAAVLGAAIVARRFRVRMVVPVAIAEAIVVVWRVRVPAAYDEQYEVLLSSLPSKLDRIPAALLAVAKHAVVLPEWGGFWIAVAASLFFVRGRRAAIPLVAMTLALAAYVAALAVTSWRIEDLAPVAVNRLLLHLLVPAACLVAAAFGPRNTPTGTVVTAHS